MLQEIFLSFLFLQKRLKDPINQMLNWNEICVIIIPLDATKAVICCKQSVNVFLRCTFTLISAKFEHSEFKYEDLSPLLSMMLKTYKLDICQKMLMREKFPGAWHDTSYNFNVESSDDLIQTVFFDDVTVKGKPHNRNGSVAFVYKGKRMIESGTEFEKCQKSSNHEDSIQTCVSPLITVNYTYQRDSVNTLLQNVVDEALKVNEPRDQMSNNFLCHLFKCCLSTKIHTSTLILEINKEKISFIPFSELTVDYDCKSPNEFKNVPLNSDKKGKRCVQRARLIEDTARRIQIVQQRSYKSIREDGVQEVKSKSRISGGWIAFFVMLGVALAIVVCLIIFYFKYIH